MLSRGDITTGEQQDGFMSGKYTTDTTFALTILAEKYLD